MVMKELSIEEKAKRYDKAIERAKAYKGLRSEMEIIFPELRESEDERIRNFISNELVCLRATDEKGTVRYNELTEAIAYLEKQGEQKPIEWSEEDEKRLNHIIQFLEDKDRWKDGERAFPIEEDVRWLNLAFPQRQWKPSEEQLQALRWVCNRTFIAQEPQKESALKDLCKQLKSL